MKIDISKLKDAGFRNLRASVELLSAIETIERFIPPEEKGEIIEAQPEPQKLLTDGRRRKKKSKISATRRAILRKQVQKTLKWNATHKVLCEHCNTMIDPRAIKRHKTACKKRMKRLARMEAA